MIQSNEVKQGAGSLVNLPPDGSPQDMGGAEGYGRGLQPYLPWRDPHFGSDPLRGRGGKGNHENKYCLHLSQQFQTGT